MKSTCSKSLFLLTALISILFFPFLNTSFALQTLLSGHEIGMSAPAEVVPFAVRGAQALCYELAVSDVSQSGLELKSVEILEGETGAFLKSYTGKALKLILRKPGEGILDNTLFIWIRQSPKTPVPQSLFHRVKLSNAESGQTLTVEGAPVSVKLKTGIILRPLLKGSDWIASETASRSLSHHRRGIIDFRGKPYISQRYAIDWLLIGPNGVYKTDGKSNEDYYCYGKELLAVADGEVVDARDGIPENTPDPDGNGHPVVPITYATVGGNYVVLKIADGVYAFYCHMITGAVAVKIHDKVKAGDVLGKLGNSGNSDGPHLHFHVGDYPDLLQANGLPYVFESYILQEIIKGPTSAQFGFPMIGGSDNEELYVEDYPLNGSVVRFGSP